MNLPNASCILLAPNVRRKKFAVASILGAVLMAFCLPPAAAETVPPPHDGLGSNHNYYLYHDGKPIMGLTVTVEIIKDIVCDDIGFHLQLNANSPLDVKPTGSNT